jgi:50S ribosomal subunit-associated GTPase HflX
MRGGEGEKQLELEARRLQEREVSLRAQLEKIRKTRELQRQGRSQVVTVALVGYTSAGKSSLHAKLTNRPAQEGRSAGAQVGQTSKGLANGEHLECDRK